MEYPAEDPACEHGKKAVNGAVAGSWRRRIGEGIRAHGDPESWLEDRRRMLERMLATEALPVRTRARLRRELAELCEGVRIVLRWWRRRQGRAHEGLPRPPDPVTGLPFQHDLARATLPRMLARELEAGHRVAVLDVDVAGLGAINEEFGRRVGDRLLRVLAGRLRRTVRAGDVVARGLGDRFLCMVGRLADRQAVERVAARVVATAATPVTLDGRAIPVALHAGVAMAPDHGSTLEELLHRAELALREAKFAGMEGYRFYAEELAATARARFRLVADLRRALAERAFELHFQPQVDLRDGRVLGVEALVRWRHPERGLIPPLDFLPAVEAAGLAVPLGEWILEAACHTARRLRAEGHGPLRMAVNLGPGMVQRPELARFVLDLLADCGLEPSDLELEITENVLLDEPRAETLEWMDVLATRGVHLALDDFGTGYASLVHLKRFPIHRVKIDRSFVRDIERDPSDCAIIRAIVGLATGLGLEVVAEGVETEAQRRFLLAHGCRAAQGYLFAPPLTEAELCAFLAERARTDSRLPSPSPLPPNPPGC